MGKCSIVLSAVVLLEIPNNVLDAAISSVGHALMIGEKKIQPVLIDVQVASIQ
jgi:hypothetical protein